MPDLKTWIPDAAASLTDWLREGEADVGTVRVVDATLVWDEDAEDKPILRLSVVLANPSGETWPVDDIVELHGRIENHVAETGLEAPLHVGLAAEAPEEVDP